MKQQQMPIRIFALIAGILIPSILMAANNALLHIAASNGDIQMIAELVDAGADVNAQEPDHGFTPIMAVVSQLKNDPDKNNLLNALKLLVNHGADLYLKNNAHETVFDLTQQLDPDLKQKVFDAVARAFSTEITIIIPRHIAQATDIKTFNINLDDEEPIQAETFKEIIDNRQSALFELIFTQDAHNNWHTMLVQPASLQLDPNRNPFNRQEIKHRVKIVITKYYDKYQISSVE